MKPLYNDVHFPIRRAKRGGGVGVASQDDKWPNGRVPYDARFTPLMGKSTDFSMSDLKRVNRAYSCWGYMNRNG
ncbi:hypothetical protein NECAME_16644 [Necator americanus]|uniref:Peptidase M12A domain-containing protein n=1 Tax=Necator americanus TaxID=51031 RepID=W2TUP1_NECAM|nr:hypothetical protein NECAME_16644 [Necator americanus]ETN85815.1 hypothetical protein NECAME_16644 [Necator americanus]